MRCLWLSGDIPVPADSGRRTYSRGLAESLARAGADVVALGIGAGVPHDSPVEWRPVPVSPARPRWRKLAGRWPSMAQDRDTAAYRAALAAAVGEGGWDVAVIDHLQMVWVIDALGSTVVPVLHVSHNHEGSTRRKLARGESWRNPEKLPLLVDAERAARAERRLVAASALVTAVTEEDASRLRVDGAREVVVITPGFGGTVRAHREIDERTPRVVAMVTNLDWHVKQRNLARFLRAADGPFASAGIELRIVGPAPAPFVAELGPRLRATRFVGHVDDLATELGRARVGVVCEPEGGGFKLKSLDYVFGRLPMAVLDGSVTGLPLVAGRDLASASTETSLAAAVVSLVDDHERCQELQVRAFDRCDGAFEWSDRGEALLDALHGTVT